MGKIWKKLNLNRLLKKFNKLGIVLVFTLMSMKLIERKSFEVNFKFNSVDLTNEEKSKLLNFFDKIYMCRKKDEQVRMKFTMTHFGTSDEEKLGELRLRKVYQYIVTEIDSTLKNKILFNPEDNIIKVDYINGIDYKKEIYHGVAIVASNE